MIFAVGDRVRKAKGYPYPGIVVAAFVTTAGKPRYVVECVALGVQGMLHIYSGENLIQTVES